jgi:broad-specificity NMP kinase
MSEKKIPENLAAESGDLSENAEEHADENATDDHEVELRIIKEQPDLIAEALERYDSLQNFCTEHYLPLLDQGNKAFTSFLSMCHISYNWQQKRKN